jgi:3-oxoacyl-[acyl-carrier protein] reductase
MARNIVITGGGTGIGRAVAARFAQAGDDVTIVGRRADVLARAAAEIGGQVTAQTADVSDPAQVEALRAELPGSVDVLVNCAGGNTDLSAPAGDGLAGLAGVAAGWRANLEANVLTAVLVSTALEDRLAAGGTVVQIGSIAADRGRAGSYGAAKAALARWNIDLAGRLGPRGITANVVSCGYISDTEFFAGTLSEQRREFLVEETMVKRAGTPGDVAGVIEFLASPAARHVTGQVLNVNGGAWASR